MNLGQIVGLLSDIETLREDRGAHTPAPRPPMGVVTHHARLRDDDSELEARRGLAARIRSVIPEARRPMSFDDVHAALGPAYTAMFSEERVQAALHGLATAGDTIGEGKRGRKYTLSDQGRTKLAGVRSPRFQRREDSVE